MLYLQIYFHFCFFWLKCRRKEGNSLRTGWDVQAPYLLKPFWHTWMKCLKFYSIRFKGSFRLVAESLNAIYGALKIIVPSDLPDRAVACTRLDAHLHCKAFDASNIRWHWTRFWYIVWCVLLNLKDTNIVDKMTDSPAVFQRYIVTVSPELLGTTFFLNPKIQSQFWLWSLKNINTKHDLEL